MIEKSTLQTFHSQDWNTVIRQMTAIAEIATRKKLWKTHKGSLPKGFTTDDLVQEAIDQVLSGKRVWNKERYPDFLKFMTFNVLRSIISNLSVSSDNQKVVSLDAMSRVDAKSSVRNSVIESKAEDYTIEDEMNAKEMNSLIEHKLNEDPDALCIFDELKKGKSNLQISEALGVDVSLVENAKKRIQTATINALKKTDYKDSLP